LLEYTGFHAKKANSLKMLNQARSLLYHYYVEVCGWKIYKDNPSGIRIEKSKEGFMLNDDYDEQSIWFLLYLKQHPIGCIRICGSGPQNILEMEKYANAQNRLKHIFSQRKQLNLVEFNREVVLPQYVCNESLLSLLEAPLIYCLQKNCSILTSCVFKEWYTIYTMLGFKRLTESQFKYHDTDPNYVDIFFTKNSSLSEIVSNIALLSNSSSNIQIQEPYLDNIKYSVL